MAYTTQGRIQNYLTIDIDPGFTVQVSEWITAAENYINNYTGRKDGFEAASQVRYYDGNGKRELDVNPFVAISSIVILESSGTDTEYTLTEGWDDDFVTYPYGDDSPKHRLILSPNSQVGSWLKGGYYLHRNNT